MGMHARNNFHYQMTENLVIDFPSLSHQKKKKIKKEKKIQIHVYQTKQSEYIFIGGELPDLVVLWNHTM
jgi:hypothetical protein